MEADIRLHQEALGWYLGIDFGTTGISAALFNGRSKEIYPIYWELVGAKPELNIPEINLEFTFSTEKVKTDFNSTQRIYRLPSIVYIDHMLEIADNDQEGDVEQTPLLLQGFKPCLKLTIPYIAVEFPKQKLWERPEVPFLLAPNFHTLSTHEPVLQWSEEHQVPLSLVKQGLVTLLTTLQPQGNIQNSIF